MSIGIVKNTGLALNLLNQHSNLLNPIFPFLGVYFNIIIILILTRIKRGGIENLYNGLLLLLVSFNVNFIEKVVFSGVTDYIKISYLQLFINISDIVMILSAFYITFTSLRLFVFNSSFDEKRSSLGLGISFQRKLSRFVFLWSLVVQLPWIFVSQGFFGTNQSMNILSIALVVVTILCILNSILLVVLILDLNQSSIGVLYGIKRSFDQATNFQDLKIECRSDDNHDELLSYLNKKIEKFNSK